MKKKTGLIDPMQILERGYSLTYKDGKLIKSVNDLKEGDQIESQLADGKVESKITKSEAGSR